MTQLQHTMASLRMTLAEIQNKEQQLDSMVNQFRSQLRRLPRQVIYAKTALEMALSSMGEIEERLSDALATRRRLQAIKKSAQQELDALQRIKQVDEARRSLAELRQGMTLSSHDATTLEAEVQRLEQFIVEHSKMAEWAITASYKDQEPAS